MTYTIIRTITYKNYGFYYETFGKHMNPHKAKAQWDKVQNFKNPTCKYYLIPDNKLDAFLALCEEKYQKQAEIVRHNAEVRAKRWEIMEHNYYRHGCHVTDAIAYLNH